MPKRGEYKKFDYSGTRRQGANFTILYHAARAASVRRVAAPYKVVNKFVQTSRLEISAHIAYLFTIHFYLLL